MAFYLNQSETNNDPNSIVRRDANGNIFGGRYNGFALQAPATWTANSATFSVNQLNVAQTANTASTSFTNATSGIVGQELTVLIQDGYTTINHLAGGTGQFNLKTATNSSYTNGDVVKLVYNSDTIWHEI